MKYTTLETVTVARPHDATHFCPETDSDWACWFKKSGNEWDYMYADNKPKFGGTGEWREKAIVDEATMSNMIKL